MENTSDYVLAVLSAKEGRNFTPVQIQKLFFILDREIPNLVDGPHFEFRPYDYGPFDSAVYGVLEGLIASGRVVRSGQTASPRRTYQVTNQGLTHGRRLFANNFEDEAKRYVSSVVDFVSKCSFSELVSAVYKQYPEMKVNSVFNG